MIGMAMARDSRRREDISGRARGMLDSVTIVRTERIRVQTREWLLTAAVIVIPLIIAVVVTMLSLEQVRYRPKKRHPAAAATRETGAPVDRGDEPGESRDS